MFSIWYPHFKVCKGSSTSPSAKEIYDVVLEIKNNGTDEFQKIEEYLKEYQTIEKEINSLRFDNEEKKKDIRRWLKDENILLSNFDMYKNFEK